MKTWCGAELETFDSTRSGRESTTNTRVSPRPASIRLSRCPRFPGFFLDPGTRPDTYPIPFPLRVVAEVLQALASSIKGIVKKGFTEAHAFEHYGMICLALDEIVSDGVVEATTWDTIRRAIKLKMAD